MTKTLAIYLVAIAFGALASVSHAEKILVDFGSDSSFRGISTASPDTNGNHWTSTVPGAFLTNLIDSTGAATTVDLGFSTAVSTDSFNGPAGATSSGTLAADLLNTDIDSLALGDLGIDTAAFDYAAGVSGAVRFEIQELDPAKTYDLSFFSSHKFSGDNETVFTVYTDNTYTTAVASGSLAHQDAAMPWLHNRDTVLTLSGLSPQTSNILYVEFVGDGGGNGYLNSLKIESAIPEPSALLIASSCALVVALRRS